MPARQKINLEKVKASLATPCSSCGYEIPPAELRRITSTQVRCPKCGVTFTKRFGLNCGNSAHKLRTLVYHQPTV
jgi:hypothetical protein